MSPTGPAGGQLNGFYPNPGVTGLSAVIAESAGNTADIATLQGQVSTLQGQVSGLQSQINSLNTQVVNLTALTYSLTYFSNQTTSTDGFGLADLSLQTGVTQVLPVWNSSGAVGVLSATNLGSGHWQIMSSAGATDGGLNIGFVTF